MTHDELLEKINNLPETIGLAEFKVRHDALRAVVGLHKPIEGNEHLCSGCWFGDGMMSYPCLTIQAIEKELSDV
jgi:hypothetical protein